jgi:RimJ/RimL family protein N-acetyltransferase
MSTVGIHEIGEQEAASFIALFEMLVEDPYFFFEPGERGVTAEEQQRMLRGSKNAEDGIILVAAIANQLVGFVSVNRGRTRRTRSTASLVIGVLRDFRRRGLGLRLMAAAEEWARRREVHRLELSVVEDNAPAIALYKRAGFTHEGQKRESLKINHRLIGEKIMGKILVESGHN